MRLAEKTVELNFCKAFPSVIGQDLFWFGLTQKQEARAGFDACSRAGAVLLLFQVKASSHVLGDGSRRFVADHHQMQALRGRVKSDRRVFYVLPTVGTTLEARHGHCFASNSRYLDVALLPVAIPQPVARWRVPPTVRKSGRHYIDLHPGLRTATIHSRPFEARVLGADELVGSLGVAASRVPTSMYVPQPSDDAILSEFQVFWSGLATVDRRGLLGAYAV